MEPIPPEINRINGLLIDHYGLHTSSGQPLFRVVWTDDQFEHRLMPSTDNGIVLLFPEVRLVPKYPYIKNRYELEWLMAVPDQNMKDIPATKLSYEPIWTFEDRHGNALPPKFEVCKHIIDGIYEKLGIIQPRERHPDGETTEEQNEIERQRILKLEQDIFGDETDISDHLSRHTGVVIDNTNALIKES